MGEPYCDIGDLPVAQCGCDKHRGKAAVTVDMGVAVRTMLAKFASYCPWCDDEMEIDDVIHLIDGQWVCGRHAL